MQKNHNQNPIFGYFGKLPVFNDFIKYNAGNNEILVLDKWLQEGIILAKQKLKSVWKTVYKNSLPLRFFYPFAGIDKFISGIIFPGSDKSDRDFPFIIFFIFKKDIIDNVPFYLLPLQFNNELNSFESIYNEVNVNTSLENLNEHINRLSSSFPEETLIEKYQIFIDDLTQSDFWERIFDLNKEKKYRLINNIFHPDIKNSRVALRLNFYSDDRDNVFDICFLLNILAVSKNEFFLPAIFWTKDIDNNNCLYIFPSKPNPSNYLDIIFSSEDSDRMFKLEEESPREDFSSIKALLNNKEGKLKELLQILNSNLKFGEL